MNMKKIIVLAFTLFLAAGVQAGNGLGLIDLGVKGGVSSQKFKFKGGGTDLYGIDSHNRTGFHVGVMGRVNLVMFHIQPELIYTRSGYNLDSWAAHSPANGIRTKVRTNTIDMPVLAGLRLLWFRLQAGPVFNLWTDNDTSGGGVSDITLSQPTMSYMIGLGFDIGKINLDVRYNGQFKRTEHNIQFTDTTPGYTYKSNNRMWLFSVGYMF